MQRRHEVFWPSRGDPRWMRLVSLVDEVGLFGRLLSDATHLFCVIVQSSLVPDTNLS